MNAFYYNIVLTFLGLWLTGFSTKYNSNSNVKIKLSNYLSRFLFLVKVKERISLQSVIFQICVYVYYIYVIGEILFVKEINHALILSRCYKFTLTFIFGYMFINIIDLMIYKNTR